MFEDFTKEASVLAILTSALLTVTDVGRFESAADGQPVAILLRIIRCARAYRHLHVLRRPRIGSVLVPTKPP